MTSASWDPVGGRMAFGLVLGLPGDGKTPGRVVFTRESGLAFSLQCAWAAEKCAIAGGLKTASQDEDQQAVIDGMAIPITNPAPQTTFGGAVGLARQALKGRSRKDLLTAVLTQQETAALYVLAVERSLRITS